MSQARTVAVVVGSLRKDSASRKVAKAIAALAPKSLQFKFVEIGDLPFFDQDLEATPPAQWTTLAQPEAYLGNSLALFDEAGELVNEGTADFLRSLGQVFATWIETHAAEGSERAAA